MFFSYAKCINIDTGTSVGDLTGNTKQVNSVAFRPARPFRIVTASEDFTSQLFEGPPFKKKGEKHEHTNFCQAVRFSPDGKIYITVGSDCKVNKINPYNANHNKICLFLISAEMF